VKWFARVTVLIAVVILCGTYSCSRPENGTRLDEGLNVLTTIAPLYCFTLNIAGDSAQVENLLPSGVGPHEYSLSPDDAKKIANARLVVKNGVGLEAWLDRIVHGSGSGVPQDGNRVVDTSKGISLIDNDPHIWLSPRNAMTQVRNIRDALAAADSANREVYTRNAAAYLKELEALDREIKDGLRTVKSREIVSFHRAFAYFIQEYGLVQAAVIQTIHEVDPSPRHIAAVIETIRSKGITALFTEPQVSHKIVDSLAHDLNLRVYSLDTLETGNPDKTWYVKRMKMNLNVLQQALNGER